MMELSGDHLPRGLLESLSSGVLPDSDRARVQQHVGQCAACHGRLERIQDARRRYESARPAAPFAAAVMARASRATEPASGTRRGWLRGLRLGLVLGAAAAGLLLTVGPWSQGIRFKGDAPIVWNTFAKRGATSWAVRDGELLKPGDTLAFTYTVPADRYLIVFGIDDEGQVTAYGPAAPLLLAQRHDRVPFGIELDSRPGTERLFAFFSPTAQDLATVRAGLRDGFARARANGQREPVRDMTVALPAAVQVRTLWFVKR